MCCLWELGMGKRLANKKRKNRHSTADFPCHVAADVRRLRIRTLLRREMRSDGTCQRAEAERQRTAALQNLAAGVAREKARQRLGVRLSSAALYEI
jgi:hypothetical protein